MTKKSFLGTHKCPCGKRVRVYDWLPPQVLCAKCTRDVARQETEAQEPDEMEDWPLCQNCSDQYPPDDGGEYKGQSLCQNCYEGFIEDDMKAALKRGEAKIEMVEHEWIDADAGREEP